MTVAGRLKACLVRMVAPDLADLVMLDTAEVPDHIAALKAMLIATDAKRYAVAHARLVHGVRQRRTCEALDVDRSSLRCRSLAAG